MSMRVIISEDSTEVRVVSTTEGEVTIIGNKLDVLATNLPVYEQPTVEDEEERCFQYDLIELKAGDKVVFRDDLMYDVDEIESIGIYDIINDYLGKTATVVAVAGNEFNEETGENEPCYKVEVEGNGYTYISSRWVELI